MTLIQRPTGGFPRTTHPILTNTAHTMLAQLNSAVAQGFYYFIDLTETPMAIIDQRGGYSERSRGEGVVHDRSRTRAAHESFHRPKALGHHQISQQNAPNPLPI